MIQIKVTMSIDSHTLQEAALRACRNMEGAQRCREVTRRDILKEARYLLYSGGAYYEGQRPFNTSDAEWIMATGLAKKHFPEYDWALL